MYPIFCATCKSNFDVPMLICLQRKKMFTHKIPLLCESFLYAAKLG